MFMTFDYWTWAVLLEAKKSKMIHFSNAKRALDLIWGIAFGILGRKIFIAASILNVNFQPWVVLAK